MQPLVLSLADEQATLALGARIAATLRPGVKLYLSGDLGAGKTTLVRGVLRELGHEHRVKSPTYTLVELYKLLKLDLYHFDLYRFKDPAEWIDAGLRELVSGPAVVMVEWPERAQGLLPAPDVVIDLALSGQGRQARLAAHSAVGEEMVTLLARGE